jgi:hypothetical protein
MALPPTIPTSFTPHPTASSAARNYRFDFVGAFGFLSYAILVIAIVLAVGVFFYSSILSSQQSSKDAELAKAEAAIDTTTAENFVRLSNRLSSGKTLLANHVISSNFFTTLGMLLPATVRFAGLHVSFPDNKKITLEGSGTAKSFNALAVASQALASDGRIKDAIFSHISVNKDNSVAFTLSADIDPKLMSYLPVTAAPPPAMVTPTASSTPTP